MAFKSFGTKVTERFQRSIILPTQMSSVEKASFIFSSSDGDSDNSLEKSQKSFIPGFKKGEQRGQPKGYVDRILPANILRRMYHYNPVVYAAINAIINVVVSAKWDITQKDKDTKLTEGQKEAIKKVKKFLYVPNKNKESFRVILEKVLRDLLILGAGVLEKGRSDYDETEMVELFAIDSAFLKIDSDEHGRIKGYWQELQGEGYEPVHFEASDLIYIMLNPRSESLYGASPLEILHNTVTAYLFAESHNIKYFENSSTPRGILDLGVHIQEHQLDRFRSYWQAENVQQPHRTMVVGGSTSGVKWIPVAMNPRDMDLMNYLNWLMKIILMAFGVTPSEVGWTDNIGGAPATGQLLQSEAFRNKAIYPMMDKMAFYFTQELVLSEFKYEDLQFEFIKESSLQEQEQKARIHQILVSSQLRTPDELRKEDGLDPMPQQAMGAPGAPGAPGGAPGAAPAIPGMPPAEGAVPEAPGEEMPPAEAPEIDMDGNLTVTPDVQRAFSKLKQEVLTSVGKRDDAVKEAFTVLRDDVLSAVGKNAEDIDMRVESVEESYKKLVGLIREILPGKQLEL